jgi:hypothetical protein
MGSFYSNEFLHCKGAAHSITTNLLVSTDPTLLIPPTFDIVCNNGAIYPMVPWKELFISFTKLLAFFLYW